MDSFWYSKVIVSALVVCGFIAAIFLLMTVHIDFTQTAGQAFLILVGVLSQSFAQVTNYWLGSSAGSAAKGDQIAALVAKTTPPNA